MRFRHAIPRLSLAAAIHTLAVLTVFGASPDGMSIDERPLRVALRLDPAATDEFHKGAWFAGVVAGAGIGFRTFGGLERHDFLLADLRAGRLISGRFSEGRWYEGHVELLGHLTVGTQYHPD
ncbi:MAG TPA: hypothetical protein VMS21_11225, partial [Methylomirabilota bacterium]|nr:hypothetical protein [Methylomirabilota bacterium]